MVLCGIQLVRQDHFVHTNPRHHHCAVQLSVHLHCNPDTSTVNQTSRLFPWVSDRTGRWIARSKLMAVCVRARMRARTRARVHKVKRAAGVKGEEGGGGMQDGEGKTPSRVSDMQAPA